MPKQACVDSWRRVRGTIAQRILLFAIVAGLAAALSGGAEARRSPKDQALYERAVKECNGPEYPGGAHPYINYSGGWFRCVSESKTRR
jgi:hypothetical protein